MKARLVPIYFKTAERDEFDGQLGRLKDMLAEEAEFLEPAEVGAELPEADAVIFPQLVGEAYREIGKIKKIKLPILAVTSEFGNVSMWDWEIVTFFRAEGLKTFAPYNLELTKTLCRSLGVKRELKGAKFLVFQDNPGDGMQASIFKRFYWWEDECSRDMKGKFGVTVVEKSFKKLGEAARQVPMSQVEKVMEEWNFKPSDIGRNSLCSAIKMYIVLKQEAESDEAIKGMGINCLNESFYSDTTPCLAWSMLYREKGIMWACEADTLSLMTQYIINKALNTPVMMSNLYPFLMGMAALKHEKIDKFPEVREWENCILVVHCGYMGFIPECMASEFALKSGVLEIIDKNAHAVDARFPAGDITMAKLHHKFNKLQVVDGVLESYAQYPGSDCRNGAIIRVRDGHKLMNMFYSHHACFIPGRKKVEIDFMADILGLDVESC